MPLEIKVHTVPHFKALNSGKEKRGQQGYAGTFHGHQAPLKST